MVGKTTSRKLNKVFTVSESIQQPPRKHSTTKSQGRSAVKASVIIPYKIIFIITINQASEYERGPAKRSNSDYSKADQATTPGGTVFLRLSRDNHGNVAYHVTHSLNLIVAMVTVRVMRDSNEIV